MGTLGQVVFEPLLTKAIQHIGVVCVWGGSIYYLLMTIDAGRNLTEQIGLNRIYFT